MLFLRSTRPGSGPCTARSASALLVAALTLTTLLTSSQTRLPVSGATVTPWLTTTDDPGGRNVVRALEEQPAVPLEPGTTEPGTTERTTGPGTRIAVNADKRYQPFTGGGASFTDSAAWLLNSSGALDATQRERVMRKLFSREDGIGLSLVRNPMGASDLTRYPYSYDDRPAGSTDPGLEHFSIGHDLHDVLPLTRRAKELNPELTVMASPWSAPGWMKDSGRMDGGSLAARHYGTYARYFVKYLQAYEERGVPVDFVTAQNEPTCCDGYPSMDWKGGGLHWFTANELLPRLEKSGLGTKVLAHDWNWDTFEEYGAPTVDDPEVRAHPNFGGIAWHGYTGDVSQQHETHTRYPDVPSYGTEHSGGRWVKDQQAADMRDIIEQTRHWSRSVTKWSLALDQENGPHSGGCGTCTGLVTVHNGDGREGVVDYTVEYWTLGHLTKFVRPGARRIDSTGSKDVPNVAWLNPDGSRALIAFNGADEDRTLTVTESGNRMTYTLPGNTSATFTWDGEPSAEGPSAASDSALGDPAATTRSPRAASLTRWVRPRPAAARRCRRPRGPARRRR